NYEVTDKNIILKPKPKTQSSTLNIAPPNAPLVQQHVVSGIVKDAQNAPMPGVNLLIKGTRRGTMTDPEGNFIITAKQTDTLVFSYLGYKTVERSTRSSVIIVQMEENVMAL